MKQQRSQDSSFNVELSFCASQPSVKVQRPSEYIEQYNKHMHKPNAEAIAAKEQALRKNNFIKTNKPYQFFMTDIVGISGSSILYQTTFGFYKTNIAVNIANICIDNLSRIRIGSGSTCSVSFFQSEEKIIVKSWQIQKLNLYVPEKFLIEIFLSKFASALSIGPHFYQIYGYDMIRLNGRFQFCMELCVPRECENVGWHCKEKLKKDILENLAILHHFNCVHRDIKPENIGWSSQKKKFVIIDFGFSGFLQQSIGEKTLALFKGTFNYSSKQLQDLYRLNTPMFVDLYYNDLIGALKSISGHHYMKSYEELGYSKTNYCREIDLINFYQLSHSIFTEDKQKTRQLVIKESTIVITFRKIIQENMLFQYFELLQQKIEKIYGILEFDYIINLDTFDSQLYRELKKQTSIEFLEPNIKNIEILFEMKRFNEIWEVDLWMEKIFDLLFFQETYHNTFSKLQKKIMKHIFDRPTKGFSLTQIFFEVLSVFQEHFIKIKSIQYLHKIKDIYVITGRVSNQIELQHQIWQVILELDSQISCLIGLHCDLCRFLPRFFHGFKWVFYGKIAQLKKHTNKVFSTCINILDNFNYLQNNQENFNRILCLMVELGNAVSEPIEKNFYQKCVKSFEYLKKISLCFFRPLERECFLKVSFYQTTIFDDPHIQLPRSLKSHFQFLYELRSNIFRITQNNKKCLAKQIKNYIGSNFILRQIQSIWLINVFLLQDKFASARDILLKYISQSKVYCLELFQFLTIFCIEIIIIKLPESCNCYELLMRLYKQLDVGDLGLLSKPLERVNYLGVEIYKKWQILGNDKKFLKYYEGYVEITLDFMTKVLVNLKNILPDSKQIRLIQNLSSILFQMINQNRPQKNQQQASQIISILRTIQNQLQLNSCFSLLYCLIKVTKEYFSQILAKTISQQILGYFQHIDSNQKALILKVNTEVNAYIHDYLLENKQYQKYLEFLARFNRSVSSIILNHAFIEKRLNDIPHSDLINFTLKTIIREPLIMVDAKMVLFCIAFIIFKIIGQYIPYQAQQRLIRMISQGIQRNILGLRFKRQIAEYILKWQRNNKKNYPQRVKFINHKTQIIMEGNGYKNYRMLIENACKNTGMGHSLKQDKYLKKKLGRTQKRINKLRKEENNKRLQQILSLGWKNSKDKE